MNRGRPKGGISRFFYVGEKARDLYLSKIATIRGVSGKLVGRGSVVRTQVKNEETG